MPPGTDNGEIIKARYSEELIRLSLDKVETFYVKIMVQKSEDFTRDGLDIHGKVDIDAKTALYGGKVEAKAIHSPLLSVDIPPGTSSHDKIIVHGEGIKIAGVQGDLHYEVGINLEEVDAETVTALSSLAPPDEEDCSNDVIEPIVRERNF